MESMVSRGCPTEIIWGGRSKRSSVLKPFESSETPGSPPLPVPMYGVGHPDRK